MPNLNGLELLKRVKDKNPKVRTVLISAFEVESDPIFKQYIQDGIIDNFMKKPIVLIHFVAKLVIKCMIFEKPLTCKSSTNEIYDTLQNRYI